MLQLELMSDLVNKSPELKAVNVASVRQISPFRYPGGKTWLVPEVRNWLTQINRPNIFIEPFVGGGSVSLAVALEGLSDQVLISELDPLVAAVWHTLINDENGPEWLINKILKFELSVENTLTVLSNEHQSTREIAFATILRNRVNHGGILTKGTGLLKHGESGKGIASRWYPETLAKRITVISSIRDRITFREGDAFDVIDDFIGNERACFFIDPPYTAGTGKRAGRRLYEYNQINHELLMEYASKVKGRIMMTYDDAEDVIQLAKSKNLKISKIPMRGTQNVLKNELIIKN